MSWSTVGGVVVCGRVVVALQSPLSHRQHSIIYTGVNSCDRGFLSLSSAKTHSLVSISHDKERAE